MVVTCSGEMSQVKRKQPTSAVSARSNKQTKCDKGKARAGEKRKYFYKHMEPKPKETKKNLFLPPRDAAEFSANWKSLLVVLHSADNSNAKKLQLLPIKESHKAAQSTNDGTNKPGHKDLNKSLNRLRTKVSEVAGMEQSGNHPKQHKTEKRKMNDAEGGHKKQTDKRKKVEEVEKKPREPDIWFDDIDPEDIEAALGSEAANIVRKRNGVTKADANITQRSTEQLLVKGSTCDGLTRTIAMDCEMVGVGPGGEESMLARVSIVNYFGKCVYDKYVKPTEKVTDYRTAVSGIRPGDIEHGENFKIVQQEVAKILEGRILVGHAIHNDLKILLLDHPKRNTRDTQKYKPFKKIVKSGRPALRVLCQEILNVKVQQGEHSSSPPKNIGTAVPILLVLEGVGVWLQKKWTFQLSLPDYI
ncbi:RNA exonuclease 4 isoform X2 [Neoarius graeffei]|uniref:RNA exonuclease 4 isoform X2 n=1 Tax=Neoarius graeffei TaxID=443677 RepID=UPI00298CE989|nr:RNA exonuclease 4 isoform X2 [Neoarius graeffei]